MTRRGSKSRRRRPTSRAAIPPTGQRTGTGLFGLCADLPIPDDDSRFGALMQALGYDLEPSRSSATYVVIGTGQLRHPRMPLMPDADGTVRIPTRLVPELAGTGRMTLWTFR